MLNIIIKYLFEAIAISIAAYYIPKKQLNFVEIFKIAITGAITYLLLDLYSPLVSTGLRIGTGMTIGQNMVNNPVSITGMIPNNNSNPIIGGYDELTECVNVCNEGEKSTKEQCIDGCNDVFSGGSFSSNPLQLKGGNEAAFQECMEELNDYDICSSISEQIGGNTFEPSNSEPSNSELSICEETGIIDKDVCKELISNN
jgi:hypothetical protein